MIEDHLGKLRREGQLESEGFFTLDLSSKHRKSLDFYREQSSFWQLKFVQFATQQGADRLDITLNKKELVLRASGVHHEQVPPLKSGILELIVQGCLAQEKDFAITQYGPVPWRLEVTSDGVVKPGPAPSVGRTPRLVIEGPGHGQKEPSFWKRWFSRSRETADWVQLMGRRCRHLPVPMKIDGLKIQGPHLFGFRPLAVLKVGTNLGLFQSDWQGSAVSKATHEFDVDHESVQALVGIPDIPGGVSTIYLLRDGIFLHAYRTNLGWPGTEVLLDSPHFITDSTTLQIVEDDTFYRVILWLKSLIEEQAKRAYELAGFWENLDPGTLRAVRQQIAILDNKEEILEGKPRSN